LGVVRSTFDAGHFHDVVVFLTPGYLIGWTIPPPVDGHFHVFQKTITAEEALNLLEGKLSVELELLPTRNLSDGALHIHRIMV
jgi:hypothetical protein